MESVVVEAELSRAEATSWRKVKRSALLPDVLFEMAELLPERAEIRLLKSDCSVLRVAFVDVPEAADEPIESACS